MKIINWLIEKEQKRINEHNKKLLINHDPMIIASNCTGGFLYHWLGLRFRSPFINLYMDPSDFINAMENFTTFLNTPIIEVTNSRNKYPVGKGYNGTIIYFMHYQSFEQAIKKWSARIERMNLSDIDRMGIILSNWGGDDVSQLERFDALPFKNKVVFVDRPFPNIKSAFYIKGFNCSNGQNGNVYRTQYLNGKRYVDQFDYVTFINNLGGNHDS